MNPILDPTLRLAIAGVVMLSGLTLSFVVYAFVLHLRGLRIERRKRELDRVWRDRLLDAATGVEAGAHDQDAPGAERPEVAPDDRILFLDLVTGYARAVHGPERRNLERSGAPYLSALHPLLEDRDPYRRAYAVDILGELGMSGESDHIVRALDDPSGLVAMVAARALARRAAPTDLPLLMRRLDAFENWSTGYLASLLTSFGSQAAPDLRRLMSDRKTAGRFRSVATQALAELNDLGAVEPAVRLLPDERDDEVQADLIRLIGKLGRPPDLAVVRPFVRAPQPYVRAAAVRAIGALSDGRSSDYETVSEGLDDPSPWVALRAGQALIALGHTAELARLAESSSPRAALAAEVLAGSA